MGIALYGFNTAQGLGYVNRDIARCMGIKRWLIERHKKFPMLPLIKEIQNIVIPSRTTDNLIKSWLRGIHTLIFVETVKTESLPRIAQQLGIKVVCVPMVEGIDLRKDWTKHIDQWIAPTAFSYKQLHTMGVKGDIIYRPWPIDIRNFPFKQRHICKRFVYAQGNGGRNDRKGGLLMSAAARLVPDIPLIVYSQVQDGYTSGANHIPTTWPSTVDFRGATETPADIYKDGDVFIMPSRFEGLGLQLLECQAAGMPLICTDGPPMNECNPWKTIPCTPNTIQLAYYPYTSWDSSPESIAQVMRNAIGEDISSASRAAKDWIDKHRSWVQDSYLQTR